MGVALIPSLCDEVGDGMRSWIGGPIDPDSVFFANRNREPDWLQDDLIGVGIQTECIAGLEMKFLAEGFGEGYAAGGIDCEFADHNGAVEWVNPFLFPALSRRWGGR